MFPQYNPYPMYQQKQEVIRVNGENGARALNLPPDSSVLVIDENNPIVWLCKTDGAGYKTVTPYSIVPYKPKPEFDFASLEERIARLEGLLNESDAIGSNGKRKQQAE